jgi:hypothetical protein
MPGPYPLLQVVLHIPDVDVHRRKYAIAGNPESDELRIRTRPYRRITTEHDPVVPTRLNPTRVLHPRTR